MKNKQLIRIILVLSSILILLTIGDFISTQSIMTNYVSPVIISKIGISGGITLPVFTETENAWLFVSMSMYIRIMLLIGIGVSSYLFLKKLPG